jgi:hypothetical protein
MYKRQEITNVKTYNEFDNDLMKMCFEHKTSLKVDYRTKDMTVVFLSPQNVIYNGAFFVVNFLCLSMHIFSSPSLWFAFIESITQMMFVALCV